MRILACLEMDCLRFVAGIFRIIGINPGRVHTIYYRYVVTNELMYIDMNDFLLLFFVNMRYVFARSLWFDKIYIKDFLINSRF